MLVQRRGAFSAMVENQCEVAIPSRNRRVAPSGADLALFDADRQGRLPWSFAQRHQLMPVGGLIQR